MYQLTLIRVAVLQGLASVRETLGTVELASLCERIMQRVADIGNLHGYAFRAGRNAGVSLGRQRRREARRLAKAEAARKRAEEREYFEFGCMTELDLLAGRIPAPSPAFTRWGQMMETVRFSLAGVSVSDICAHFRVSPDVVYQWRRRALLALRPYMTSTLRQWLREHGTEFGLGYKG